MTSTREGDVWIYLNHSRFQSDIVSGAMSWDGHLKKKLGIIRNWAEKKNSGMASTKCLAHESAGFLESQLISQHHARLWNHLGRKQIITCLSGIFFHLLKANVKAHGGRWHSLGHFWVLNHIWVYVSGFSGQTETAIVWLVLCGSSTMDPQGYEGIGVRWLLRTLIFLSL